MLMTKKYSKFLCLMLCFALILSLVPAWVLATESAGDAIATPITIKPADVSGEYIPSREVVYRATELAYVGEGRLNEGDVFADVTFSGERRYAGKTESSIVSCKIMRGDVDVTSLYTNITKKPGKIDVYAFAPPAPAFDVNVPVNTVFTVEEIENLLGIKISDFHAPSFTGVGIFSVATGYTAPAEVGKAALVFKQSPRDLNGDGIADIGACTIEVSIRVISGAVAKSTGGYYETLQAAVDAAESGDTIVLVAGDVKSEVNEAVMIPADKEIIIDLNSRELYVSGEDEIINYGKLNVIDSSEGRFGWVWEVYNMGELVIDGGWVHMLSTVGDGKTIVNGDAVNWLREVEQPGELIINGGIFAFDPTQYTDDDAVVTNLYFKETVSVGGLQHVATCDGYAVNKSNSEWADSMKGVDSADEGSAVFTILKVPADAKIDIENFHADLLIDNKTNSDIILNGRILGAGVKGVKLADLPEAGAEETLYNISVEGGTARIDGEERYKAAEGESVQLNASGAPEGKEFDRWVIAGIDTTDLDLTSGTLIFTMPAGDVTAKATYRDVVSLKWIESVSVTAQRPVIGQKPSYEITFESSPAGGIELSSCYTTAVGWYYFGVTDEERLGWIYIEPDSDYVFEEGKTYALDVYLDAKDGFYFDDTTTGTINGMPHNLEAWNDSLYWESDNLVCITAVWTLTQEQVPGATDGNDTGTTTPTLPQTGDQGEMLPWIVMLILCTGAIATVVVRKRKAAK